MTLERLKVPVAIGIGAVLWAWVLYITPFWISIGLRGILGFCLLVFAAWQVRRTNEIVKENADFHWRIGELLAAVLERMTLSEEARTKEVVDQHERVKQLAEVVARATLARQTADDVALESQTRELSEKIQEGTDASKAAAKEANDVNQKIADLDQRIIDTLKVKKDK